MTLASLRGAFDGEPALVAYVAAGDPTPDATAAQVQALVEGGADVVELGLPFSEPIADGPTIQEAVVRSLESGMTPDRYFEIVAGLDVDAPLVCMTYYNLIFQYGAVHGDEGVGAADPVEPFVAAAAEAGLSGLIVPDLPVEESASLREACARHDLALVFIVAPTTTPDRMERILEACSGFLYVQARLGTTGAQADVSEDTYESLDRLPATDLPRAVGFGVSTGEQARAIVAAGADGVVAGSVFVDIVSEGETPEGSVTDRLRNTARDLKDGAVAGRVAPEGERR
ncbi:MAG: tryptophan synthase subunit alpha [Halobacteriaceae archaeon]